MIPDDPSRIAPYDLRQSYMSLSWPWVRLLRVLAVSGFARRLHAAAHQSNPALGCRAGLGYCVAPAFHWGGCKSKTLLLPTTYCPDGVQYAHPRSSPDDRMIRPLTWYTGSSSWISRIVAVPPSRVGYVLPTSICMLLSCVWWPRHCRGVGVTSIAPGVAVLSSRGAA